MVWFLCLFKQINICFIRDDSIDSISFKYSNIVSPELKEKIQNPHYDPRHLTPEETNTVLNFTITIQLIRLLEGMWSKNCNVNPTSFKTVFSEARDKFFYGFCQHDAEEAYSCIIQKMQEELAENKNVQFVMDRPSVKDFIYFKNDIKAKISATNDLDLKQKLIQEFLNKKKSMPTENLIMESYREMKKYYGTSYSRITDIFTGFFHSSITCPNPECGYSSNKFDPYLHLSFPMPVRDCNNCNGEILRTLSINDCMNEFCKEEILDESNLWNCEGCSKCVKAIKKLQLWTSPPVLVIQLKRFGIARTNKDSRLVNCPINNFDISPLISPTKRDATTSNPTTTNISASCHTYRLQSIINHYGSLDCGHYYSYCLDEDTNQWYEFNDTHIKRISHHSIITNCAYLLVYIRSDIQ